MTATLPFRRKERIKQQGELLLRQITLQDLTPFIGLTVASAPAVQLAPLGYKYLEILRNRELARSHGNYNVVVVLDDHAKTLIHWWIHNIDSQFSSLHSGSPQLELHTDASLTGWGAAFGGSKTGRHWAQAELTNILELKAILMGLQSLCSDFRNTHIRLRSNNTTAVACINKCGGTKFNLHVVTERIFDWAQSRGIVLSAEHVRGIYNVEADKESRIKKFRCRVDAHTLCFQNVMPHFLYTRCRPLCLSP